MVDSAQLWPLYLMIAASGLAFVSGFPMMMTRLAPVFRQRLATGMVCISALAGLIAALTVLLHQTHLMLYLAWLVPYGPMTCAIDPLSAFFLIPVLIVSGCCSIYALGYWPASEHPGSVNKLTLFSGILTSSLLWVVMARSAILFLFAWEIMALASFFVITAEDDRDEVREAGTLYLICAHISTLALFAVFILLKKATLSYGFPAAGTLDGGTPMAAALFILALFGFGIKAGIMPLHVWLPSAHANAPSHVSAVMSGIILKIGIYALVRFYSFFTGIPVWWGLIVLGIGVISGILGVVFAIGQHDLKRLLAYHSIENIGIIMMGIGIALTGQACHEPRLVILGMAGALLHVLNHAVFKALLFLGAGSVIHATGTREIDRMGGLIRQMPWTSVFFLVGAIAICGLPPLNGFVSELLVYLGFFIGAVGGNDATAAANALAAPALALIGGLALACFVKVFGIVFLGSPRLNDPAQAHEAPRTMRTAMAVLALVCLIIGILPMAVAPLLDAAVAAWSSDVTGTAPLLTLVPMGWITVLALFVVAVSIVLYVRWIANVVYTRSTTWGCGYLAPTPRMQYTASSFADAITGLFGGVLCPDTHKPVIAGAFPKASSFSVHVPETVLEKIYLPFFRWANMRLATVRKLQNGKLHFYILYMFLTLIALLAIPT